MLFPSEAPRDGPPLSSPDEAIGTPVTLPEIPGTPRDTGETAETPAGMGGTSCETPGTFVRTPGTSTGKT